MQNPSLENKPQGTSLTSAANEQHTLQHHSTTTSSSTRFSSTSTVFSVPTDAHVGHKPFDLQSLLPSTPESLPAEIRTERRLLYWLEQPSSGSPRYERRRAWSSIDTGDRDKHDRQSRCRQHPVTRGLHIQDQRSVLRASSPERGKDTLGQLWTGDFFEPAPAPIAETDPESTTSLWQSVRKMVGMDDQEGGSRRLRSGKQASRHGSDKKDQNDDAAEVAMSEKRISPASKDFRIRVLVPRCIRVDPEGLPSLAHSHFGVEEPVKDRHEGSYYTSVRGAVNTSIWVGLNEAFLTFVTQSYKRMDNRKLCEKEFASFAKENLLKQDPSLLNEAEKGAWKAERMLHLVVKPSPESMWQPPPLVPGPTSASDLASNQYNFDLRTDCSYWVNVKAYNPNYVSQVRFWTFVHNQEITSPYFTVEFKKDHQSEFQAQLQVAAAASVALYNRFRLRHRSLQMQGRKWTQGLKRVIRHYGMTFSGSNYTIWLIEPLPFDKEWAGCAMQRIFEGFCHETADVRNLIHWINEIHCWGLTVHAPKCQKDVKLIMQSQARTSGQRVSDIHMDSEDEEDS